ncbi:MAG: hypothetical protein EXS37_13510 [Opitutus sp.]|nr:hypothetical protein [Opitutus sp.]
MSRSVIAPPPSATSAPLPGNSAARSAGIRSERRLSAIRWPPACSIARGVHPTCSPEAMSATRHFRLAPVLLLAGCVSDLARPPAAPPVVPVAVALRDLDYSGDQGALASLDRELAAAGTDAAKLSVLADRLLALLRAGDASTAARQAACQRLGLIFAVFPPDEVALSVLRPLLLSESESDFARLALEPAAGNATDQLLIDAVAESTDRVRPGLVQTLTRRAPAVAVPLLVPLLRDADPPTAAAAAATLGRIGGPTAIAALRSAPPSPAVFAALLALAGTLSATEGAALAQALAADSRWPAHDRAAAARTLLDLEPARAVARIVEFLAGDQAALRQTALGQLGTSHAPGLVTALGGAFSSLEPSIQPAVLAALSRCADAAATPLILSATHHADPGVRIAAITALGSQPGDASLVNELGRLALTQDADEARTARAALARLHGPGVTAAILAGATSDEAVFRAVFIDQLAARNVTEGLPLLRRCRDDPNPAIRLAALNALATLAPPDDQSLLLDWLLNAPSEEERSPALRAVASVTQRNPDTTARARPIFEALEKSPPATARTLLPLLLRLGGRESAECAARLALQSDPALSTAAVATLARWPDATAQSSLVTVATSVTAPADLRATAAEAALGYHERTREPWLAADTERAVRLLDLANDLAIRARLVPLLGRAGDRAAADLAKKFQADPALADLARSAVTLIAANRAGPPAIRVSKNEEAAAQITDGSIATAWAAVITPDLWLEFDFRTSRPMHRLTFDQTGRAAEFPEQLEIYVTDDPKNSGRPVATAVGQRNRTVVDLPPGTRGRYLIVKNTVERLSAMWSISELFID